ncbi:MAG: GNAT family N-acetyltransferase [Elusimicrobiota bacterium]|jgi:ribosomal protein S18 acetylase RimI-like enzyme
MRSARSADLEAILAIESHWTTTPHWTRAQFESEFSNPRSVFLVAEVQCIADAGMSGPREESRGRLSGYGAAWAVEDELQILSVAVNPEHVRRGIGRALVEALCVQGRSRGCSRATLEVSHLNAGAVALYEGCGFVVVGRRPKFYNDGSDAVLMDKTL